ncbi:MAG: NAD(P)H-hydrate epimerase, partial [Planctomycetales bacterium]|nr:NAD(P)H-hydrate epimerase [Planctomycetales bacterium]
MTPTVLTRAQVRRVDQLAVERYGMSTLVLMENAGRGCVDVLNSVRAVGPVAVVCGKGNNGGDGFVMARHLANRSIAVRVALLCRPEELTGDAAINFAVLEKMGLSVV